MTGPRPSIAHSFAEGLAIAAKRRGWRAYIPHWLIGSMGLGTWAALSLPVAFWTKDKWDVSTAFFGAILAFDGLLLAIGWGAFSKIYEIIGSGAFAAFLRRNGLLSMHLLFIDMAQLAMVAAALTTGAALVGVLANLPLWADRMMLALSIGTSCYAIVKAMAATRAMHDLLWESANQSHVEPTGLRQVK